jgi:hypothetical protein
MHRIAIGEERNKEGRMETKKDKRKKRGIELTLKEIKKRAEVIE